MYSLIEMGYLITAFVFILALKRMSHPSTARSGVVWAGWAMVAATVITFFHPLVHGNYIGIILAIAAGGYVAWKSAVKVAMTDMPQMIAIYNGMGGGAAACIAAIELLRAGGDASHGAGMLALAVVGALIGGVSFSGSIVAWAKLDGRLNKAIRLKNRHIINTAVFGLAVCIGIGLAATAQPNAFFILIFFLCALAFGVLLALPIGGADMPVVISLFNAFTGLAVAIEGLVLNNGGLIIAGTVVGAAGTLLTQLMAKAMNRPISNVLFSNFGDNAESAEAVTGTMKSLEPMDAGVQMAYASKVIIIPGYGLAVAQAQHKVWELSQLLIDRGVDVKFAIHPVAGRMPGHMNVLLAEAGVPYDLIFDLDEINGEFDTADVALVIGANDVVNPVARTDKSSPIYGMPILNADKAKNVLVIKRGQGAGFSGIENHLFFLDNTRMVYGDGQKVVAELIASVKTL